MTRNVVSLGGICVALLFLGLSEASADWVAYNDHAPGPGTSPNATTNNIRLQTSGFLKEITTGTNLPVTLAITMSGSGVTFNNSGASPGAGTPLANTFNGFVFFGVAPDSNVEITNSTVTYTFTGLNPAMRYSFKGGANRGLTAASGSNRWTRVEISGATSFVDAHSQRVVTFAQAANDLLANQVAINFATNTVSGDIVDWEEIDPGSDGNFAVICSQYQGFIPNGGRSNGTNGYAITGIRLEEIPNGPPQIGAQPADLTVTAGSPASFTVSATGRRPFSYQWYRNGSPINGETASNYVIASASLVDDGVKFSARVSNSVGSVLSSNGTLRVVPIPVDLISVTNTLWKYDQSGANLGTAWKQVIYDDSAWPSGFGVLAQETDNQTVIPLTNTVISMSNLVTGVRITTHYFRTHINIDDPSAYSITASNLIDDGAVIYVNGFEVHREDLPNPPTIIGFNTVATAAVEAGWTGYLIASSYFIAGDNVVAAEIHNASPTSSDAVFGMRLQARELPPTQIIITNQPSDITAIEGANVPLQVGFTGNRVQLQWYRLSGDTPVLIPGATRNPYTISNVLAGDGGFYFVVISNTLGTVSSDLAELSVVADLDPPKVLTAQSLSGNSVTLSFSEPILPETATNLANYVVTNLTSGGVIGVNSATLANGTNVILTLTTPLASTENYLVLVNNLQDVSPRHNVIAPESAAPVSRELTLIGLNEPGWAFYNPVLGPPFEAFEPPGDWNQLNFQVPDNDWGQNAAGLFAYNPGQSQLPAPVLTSISGGAISSYYRFAFPFEGSPVGAEVSLRRIISDGLVGYLNGSEILRFNLPNGTVTPFTPASLDSGLSDSTFTLSGVPIRYGTNVFAVELHAHDSNDNLIAFGAELRARILSLARGPLVITAGPGDVTAVEGQAAEFKFVAAGASGFTWYTNGLPVVGADLDTLRIDKVPLGLDGFSVGVIATNSSSTAISSNAHLHVLPDLTPPRLLNASAMSNAVLLTFNEPMDASSLLNPGNYQLVSFAGTIRGIAATLTSPSNVVVSFGSNFPAGARIVINGVRDASTAQNEILCNTSATIGWDLVIPIDATWRYNTNGTDLGTVWRNRSYVDTTADWPLGAGLIADETAGLPAPIKTPISRLVNGNYHYTFYFRYHFNVPAGIQNAAVTFRHIIDDGALMYINGQQFHSFNMANDANTVTYTSQSPVAVGDAVYSAPFNTTFSNLVAGDNVIAVEVHQSGTASADVTFGAEFSMHVPSVISDLAMDRISVCQSGSDITLSWGGNRWTLEASDTLGTNAVWTPVAQHTNSFRATAAGPQRFYRLRQ